MVVPQKRLFFVLQEHCVVSLAFCDPVSRFEQHGRLLSGERGGSGYVWVPAELPCRHRAGRDYSGHRLGRAPVAGAAAMAAAPTATYQAGPSTVPGAAAKSAPASAVVFPNLFTRPSAWNA